MTSRKAIGKAGEYYVASRLILLGFNASILPVEEGVDVIAVKGGKTFYFQVKTCLSPKISKKVEKNKYQFKLNFKQLSIKRRDLFFIFIIGDSIIQNIFILEYPILEKQLSKQGVSPHVSRNVENIDAFIQEDKRKSTYLFYFSGIGRAKEKDKLDLNGYLDAWKNIYL